MPVGVVGITVVIYVIVSAAYYPAFEQFVSVIDSRIHNGNDDRFLSIERIDVIEIIVRSRCFVSPIIVVVIAVGGNHCFIFFRLFRYIVDTHEKIVIHVVDVTFFAQRIVGVIGVRFVFVL